MTQLPIPVHVGSEPPGSWDDIEARQRGFGEDASPWLQRKRRPAVARAGLDWGALGFEPRWVGFDAADCAAALQPSTFAGQDDDEFTRFRLGAESRDEIALVISPIGRDPDDKSRNVFAQHDGSVYLGGVDTSISGRPLGKGARVRAATSLDGVDSQLALRMLSCNPPPLWRSLSLHGVTGEGYNGQIQQPAAGTLVPIVETDLGEPVVVAWVSPDGAERRYVVPAETPWPLLLHWLLEQALPELVPDAMRRARRQLATDQALMTCRERFVRSALTELDVDYAARRRELERELEEAETAASAIREGLLYGTGKQLADTVRSVLEWAGVTVADLDDQLGGTKNADLLCSYGGRSRLVEVKSAGRKAPERAYEDLVRHLREWKKLPGSTPVEGGALVLNYEHRAVPHERSARPYGRPEFLAAQTEPVVTTLDLFEAWREEDADAILQLLFGSLNPAVAELTSPPPMGIEPAGLKRGWFRRR